MVTQVRRQKPPAHICPLKECHREVEEENYFCPAGHRIRCEHCHLFFGWRDVAATGNITCPVCKTSQSATRTA